MTPFPSGKFREAGGGVFTQATIKLEVENFEIKQLIRRILLSIIEPSLVVKDIIGPGEIDNTFKNICRRIGVWVHKRTEEGSTRLGAYVPAWSFYPPQSAYLA